MSAGPVIRTVYMWAAIGVSHCGRIQLRGRTVGMTATYQQRQRPDTSVATARSRATPTSYPTLQLLHHALDKSRIDRSGIASLQRTAGNAAVSRLLATPQAAVQRLLPGGTGDWHEVAQAVTIAIAGFDLLPELHGLADTAITEAGTVTAAGGDYGPQNALRHCIFAGLVTSHGWRQALKDIAFGVFVPGSVIVALFGATTAARIRLILQAHEWFADDGCGNFGTGTVDSECDQHNNAVGIEIGGPFTNDAKVIADAKAALDTGRLLMTPGPTDLSRTVSTAGWRSSPWLAGGPQQPDCSAVTKK